MIKKIIFLLGVLFYLSAAAIGWSDEPTVKLNVTVSNPATDRPKEIKVDLPLPKEIKKEDVVGLDGLSLQFNNEDESFHVVGKVTLQPAETTFFKIAVRDIWMIPEDEINQLHKELEHLRQETDEYYVQRKVEETLNILEQILTLQKMSREDTGAHIAAFRQNEEEIRVIKNVIATMEQTLEQRKKNQVVKVKAGLSKALLWLFFILLAGGVAYLFSKREYLFILKSRMGEWALKDYISLARLFPIENVTCSVLHDSKDAITAQEVGIFAAPRSLEEGKICLFLKDSYRTQTVVEIMIKLNQYPKPVAFRGAIVWQKKISDQSSNIYLTGIKLVEAPSEDFKRLKDTIDKNLYQKA